MPRISKEEKARISQEATALLQRITIVENRVQLPMDDVPERDVFLEFQRMMEADGGRWSQKEDAFVFSTVPEWMDAAKAIKEATGEMTWDPVQLVHTTVYTEPAPAGVVTDIGLAHDGPPIGFNPPVGLMAALEAYPGPVPDSGVFLPVSLIEPDPNQPRKHFDQAALEELASSIGKIGVLQRISVRKVYTTDSDFSYRIIFGERRWRAAVIAGLDTIPCDIRVMTDDEVMEVQMIENLHRVDVHPMQEAHFFQHMLLRVEGRTHHEIATQIGKTEKYVRVRLKLNNLTPEFQALYLENGITFQEAMQLATVSTETQQEYFGTLKLEGREPGDPVSLSGLKFYLERRMHVLSTAPFDIEDTTLHPVRGACGDCPYNTAAGQLFNDEQPPTCTLPNCFRTKSVNSYIRILQAHAEGGGFFIVPDEWLSDEEKFWVTVATDAGISTMPKGSFSRLYGCPDNPGTWEEWSEDNRDHPVDLSDEQMAMYQADADEQGFERPWTMERISELEAGLDVEYREECSNYEIKLAAFNEKNPNVMWAMSIGGRNRGEIVPIKLAEATAEVITQAGESGISASEASQIAGIEQRGARAKELDDERLWSDVRKLAISHWDGSVKKDAIQFTMKEKEPSAIEMGTFCVLLYNICHLTEGAGAGKALVNYLKVPEEDNHTAMEKSIRQEIFKRAGDDHRILWFLLRSFLLHEGFPTTGSHTKGDIQPFSYQFVKERKTAEVVDLELEYEGKEGKRARSREARIAAVKRQAAAPSSTGTAAGQEQGAESQETESDDESQMD